jgi:uncharacterized protein (DUF2236 family)
MTNPLAWPLDRLSAKLMASDKADFSTPVGEPSVVPPDSVSWRIFRNPVAMYVGGITAVLLELGEPRVRHGVWDHSSFKRDPAGRLQRTGMSAMITVYGARSRFEAMAARVRKMHGHVTGTTPDGQPYDASDPELLTWVQVTAGYAFLQAYCAYVAPLSQAERDRYYSEGQAGAALYGVETPPKSEAEIEAIFAAIEPKLEPSPILDELLEILRTAAILPAPLRPLQKVVVRAAVDLVPPHIRRRIGIEHHGPMRTGERSLLRAMAWAAERTNLPSSPSAQASVRMGLPVDYLTRRESPRPAPLRPRRA